MGLSKYKLGELLEQCDERNTELQYSVNDVKGMSVQKNFIETKANMTGVSLTPYKLVKNNEFAYVTVTSRNSEKITLAYNNTPNTYIVSSSYIVFKIKQTAFMSSDYLFMYFNRPEFDRYARFASWGSARETFDWSEMCDIEISLPPLSIQQKYVAIYNSLLANKQNYERGLEDLKLTCDAYIENLKHTQAPQKLKNYISLCSATNDSLNYGIDDVRGISIEKKFINTKANMENVSLKPYLVIKPDEFAYAPVTSRNGEKISVAHNNSNDTYICSSSYTVFKVANNKLLPSFLAILFNRFEFNRYARFHSWGSARETFDWDEMCDVKIPIPPLATQQSIVNIYNAYMERKRINEQLKEQLKNICPILIKGSLEEAAQRKDA